MRFCFHFLLIISFYIMKWVVCETIYMHRNIIYEFILLSCCLKVYHFLFVLLPRWLSCPAAEMVDGSRVLYFEQVENSSNNLNVFTVSHN